MQSVMTRQQCPICKIHQIIAYTNYYLYTMSRAPFISLPHSSQRIGTADTGQDTLCPRGSHDFPTIHHPHIFTEHAGHLSHAMNAINSTRVSVYLRGPPEHQTLILTMRALLTGGPRRPQVLPRQVVHHGHHHHYHLLYK